MREHSNGELPSDAGNDGRFAQSRAGRTIDAPNEHLCAISDVGQVRDHNEDAFYVSSRGPVLIVADGMGGHEAGEVASALAVGALVRASDAVLQERDAFDAERIELLLIEIFGQAQGLVLGESRTRTGCREMGTTLSMSLVQGDHLHTCHVGDSRCYVRRHEGLVQVTHDHSVVGALVRAGEITREQARVHPRKNEVLQAIGSPAGIEAEVRTVRLAEGDQVLLCTDGLWEMLSDETICTILDDEGSTRQRAERLVDRANQAGGRDNITVALYEHHRAEPAAKPD